MVLNLQLQNSEPTTIKIFNVEGQLQRQLQVAQSKVSIDLSFLTKGIYTVAMSNAFVRFTKKLRVG
jgi:Secretion system C-terminal sorting domain